MPNSAKEVISQALELAASDRSAVAEAMIASLDMPDSTIDEIWAKEADARLSAFDQGDIEAKTAEEVLSKFHQS